MSYDIRFGVKVADADGLIAVVGEPEYDSPTYNLRDMFVACMDWNYKQGEWYKVTDVIPKIERGIHELRFNAKEYEKYNPENGWGDLSSALRCLENWLEEIYRYQSGWYWEDIPIEHLWFRW